MLPSWLEWCRKLHPKWRWWRAWCSAMRAVFRKAGRQSRQTRRGHCRRGHSAGVVPEALGHSLWERAAPGPSPEPLTRILFPGAVSRPPQPVAGAECQHPVPPSSPRHPENIWFSPLRESTVLSSGERTSHSCCRERLLVGLRPHLDPGLCACSC